MAVGIGRKSIMDQFVRVVSLLSRIAGLISALLLAASVIVVCHMVLVRYVFGHSTIWQTEFVVFAMVAATFLGSPYLLLSKGHVAVDLIPEMLGGTPRRVLVVLSSLLSLVFAALLAYSGWIYFHEAWINDWRSQSVWAPPLWIPLLPLPLGIGLMALGCIAEIWQELTTRTPEGNS
jgi:TRAP-type C4-dicarboxylate transport system permease small subunit